MDRNSEYNNLKSAVLKHLRLSVLRSPTGLKDLKRLFKPKIHSVRKLSQVTTLDELVNLLERLDELSPYNVNAFLLITTVVPEERVRILVLAYEQRFKNTKVQTRVPQNNSYVSNHAPAAVNLNKPSHSALDHRGRSFKLISEKLGSNWKSMARALDISEGDIEIIINATPDIPEQILMMLNLMEQAITYEPRKLRTNLERCLRKARRNDLAGMVAKIFDS